MKNTVRASLGPKSLKIKNRLLRAAFILPFFLIGEAIAKETPLPPDGDPLPVERDASHHLSCKGGGTKVEELPMAVTQACAKEHIYRVLPRGGYNVCGRKGRKQWKACIESKLKTCVELSNMQERRVPTDYCPGFK